MKLNIPHSTTLNAKIDKAHSIYANREKDPFVDSQTDMNIVMRRNKIMRRDEKVEQHEVRAEWNSSPFPLRKPA
jgi:hypothetical protein